jgi:hypothetical protein
MSIQSKAFDLALSVLGGENDGHKAALLRHSGFLHSLAEKFVGERLAAPEPGWSVEVLQTYCTNMQAQISALSGTGLPKGNDATTNVMSIDETCAATASDRQKKAKASAHLAASLLADVNAGKLTFEAALAKGKGAH